jgi:hypothetical protein
MEVATLVDSMADVVFLRLRTLQIMRVTKT